MKPIVLIPEPISAEGLSLLEKHCTVVAPWSTGLARQEVMGLQEARKDAEAIIVRRERVDKKDLSEMTRLCVVVKHGSGVDNIDCEAATARGVLVVNTPDSVTTSVAEYTIALILAVARRLEEAFAAGRRTAPTDREQLRGSELGGKTIGVVGFGRIGRAVAHCASAGLNMRVRIFDPMIPDIPEACAFHADKTLDEMLPATDVLTLHTPLTSTTRGLISRSRLGRLRPGALLINTSRGGIVDEGALAEALVSGRLGGAALDVSEIEPLPADHPLRTAPRVILTPHIASLTAEAETKTSVAAAKAVVAAVQGRPVSGMLNPEVLEAQKTPRSPTGMARAL